MDHFGRRSRCHCHFGSRHPEQAFHDRKHDHHWIRQQGGSDHRVLLVLG
jgi:hypothetical protein